MKTRLRLLGATALLALALTGCAEAASITNVATAITCAALGSVNVGGVEIGQVCKGLEDAVAAFLAKYSSTSPTLAHALVPSARGEGAPIFEKVIIGGKGAFFVPSVAAELRKPEVKAALEAELHGKGLL